ncbi:hypothetical protein [Deinococcus arcticus]|uniref:hypothetical protein n=1 Tax=Deinococcus arcticus TaxID=2136176 RepID=UPI0011B1E5F4|nr:hypothetical protein [Deinococcus arcticus]
MLDKTKIKYYACLSILVSCVAQSSALLGQQNLKMIMTSSFCKKYKCQFSDSNELINPLQYEILLKDALGVQLDTFFDVYYENNSIKRLELQIGIDYPKNKLSPNYSVVVDDFYRLATGRQILPQQQRFYGGKVTECYDELYSLQMNSKSNTRYLLAEGKTTDGRAYTAYCSQIFLGGSKRSNRSIIITVK